MTKYHQNTAVSASQVMKTEVNLGNYSARVLQNLIIKHLSQATLKSILIGEGPLGVCVSSGC